MSSRVPCLCGVADRPLQGYLLKSPLQPEALLLMPCVQGADGLSVLPQAVLMGGLHPFALGSNIGVPGVRKAKLRLHGLAGLAQALALMLTVRKQSLLVSDGLLKLSTGLTPSGTKAGLQILYNGARERGFTKAGKMGNGRGKRLGPSRSVAWPLPGPPHGAQAIQIHGNARH